MIKNILAFVMLLLIAVMYLAFVFNCCEFRVVNEVESGVTIKIGHPLDFLQEPACNT